MNVSHSDSPAEYELWRQGRWQEIAGPHGKAKVIATGKIAGPDARSLPGVPGRWSTNEAGALTVTATPADGVRVNHSLVAGTSEVPPACDLEFPEGRIGLVGGGEGAYSMVVMDHAALEHRGITGIDTYPYNPAWVFEGEYRAAPGERCIGVERLTTPRTTEAISAPVDLAVTIDGTEYVLAVLEDFPGQRLVVFTDETNADTTPEIGRWLVLPLQEPGTTVTVDFNRATLSHHHLNPAVFVCPLSPPGNHLPLRIDAGERHLIYTNADIDHATHPAKAEQHTMSEDLDHKAVTYLHALETADWAAARAMCAADTTVWHNDGKGEQSIEDNINGMAGQVDAIESMRYDITRQFSRPGEVLQQHVVHVATKEGMRGEVHAAVYFRFDDDGLITRIEEYSNFVPADD
ncbi:DUF1684 domain-containing protein [Nocardia sp. NPDC060256]|uniref:DUF1684 domain-containing protein n=1 Tax=unclassified Nocardia TaxID=2637762 RepID=UPI00366A4678